MGLVAFIVGPLSIACGILLCGYSLVGFMVTVSTGVAHRSVIDLTLIGGLLAIASGVALIVFAGIRRKT